MSACKYLTGENSCGYEDKFKVTCKKVATPAYHRKLPLGECSWDPNNLSLPYCHLEETKGKFTFETIQNWVEEKEFEEMIQNY